MEADDSKVAKGSFCKKDIILEQFESAHEYKKFAERSLQDIITRKKHSKELEGILFE